MLSRRITKRYDRRRYVALCPHFGSYSENTSEVVRGGHPTCLARSVLETDGFDAGHYKAEEWQESSKTYIVNDQLGIQIVVAVSLRLPLRPRTRLAVLAPLATCCSHGRDDRRC